MNHFFSPAEPEDNIRRAVNAIIDPRNIVSSLRDMEISFEKAMFNEEAKFSLLRYELKDVPEILQFVIYRFASTYADLKKVIYDFESGRRIFHSQF